MTVADFTTYRNSANPLPLGAAPLLGGSSGFCWKWPPRGRQTTDPPVWYSATEITPLRFDGRLTDKCSRGLAGLPDKDDQHATYLKLLYSAQIARDISSGYRISSSPSGAYCDPSRISATTSHE